MSVSNNIAEGFERGTTAGLLTFLYIARGSAGEVRAMCCFFERRHLAKLPKDHNLRAAFEQKHGPLPEPPS